MGHSYGSWLVHDTFKAYEWQRKTLLLSICPDLSLPRRCAFLLETWMLRKNHPEIFQENFYPKIRKMQKDSWELAPDIRGCLEDSSRKFDFYWMNLDARKQVNSMDAPPANQKLFFHIREALYKDFRGENILDTSHAIYTKIYNGYYDLLMLPWHYENEDRVEFFYGSGHFPQFEEPETFIEVLKREIN